MKNKKYKKCQTTGCDGIATGSLIKNNKDVCSSCFIIEREGNTQCAQN